MTNLDETHTTMVVILEQRFAYVRKYCGRYFNKAIESPAIIVNVLELNNPAELQPSLLLH